MSEKDDSMSDETYPGEQPLPSGEEEQTLDTLFDSERAGDSAEELLKKSSPPGGTYLTRPDEYPLTIVNQRFEEKDAAGEIIGTRRLANIRGMAFATIKTVPYQIRFNNFSISPEEQLAVEYDGDAPTGERYDGKDGRAFKYDLKFRLWLEAEKWYKSVTGEKNKRDGDILALMTEVPFAVRTMQGRDGNPVVLHILEKKKGR